MELLLFLIFCVGAIVVLVRLSALSARLDEATWEIRMLKGRLGQLEHESPSATAAQTDVAPAVPTAPPAPSPAPPAAPPVAEQLPPTPPPSAQAPPKASKSKEEWEALIGGRLLNRIGAIALIIGVGFFLKYAFDRNWITEWVRVMIGAVTGVALLAGAARSHARGLSIFAQGLVGAGISILYLSAYASFNYYALVSQPVAFALMGIVTVVAFLQAFTYGSLAVSLLGWLGGFLTPLLLRSGEVNATGLFTYIALLDAGILSVLLLKPRWVILEPLSLTATYLYFFLWFGDSFGEQHLAVAVFFLSVFWFLFHGVDTARALFTAEPTTAVQRSLSVANAVAFSVAMYLVIDPGHHAWTGSVAALLGALYIGSAITISRRRADRTTEAMQYVITAIVLAVLAAEIHFDDLVVIPVYALEVVVIAWIGFRRELRYVWIAGLAVLGWAIAVLLETRGALACTDPSAFTLLVNTRAGAFLALIAATAAVLLIMRRAPRGMTPQLSPLLHSVWVFLAFLLLTTEINDLFRSYLASASDAREILRFRQGITLAAAWACFAIPLTLAGGRMDLTPLRIGGVIILCFAALLAIPAGSAFTPIEWFIPVVNIRSAMILFVGGVGLWQALWLRRKDRFAFGVWLHLPWMIMWFLFCTVETIDTYRHLLVTASPGAEPHLVFLRIMTLAAAWSVGALPLVYAGSRMGDRLIVGGGLLMGSLGTVLGILRGIAYEPVTALIPVINGRAGVLLGMILILAWCSAILRRSATPPPWRTEAVFVLRVLVIVTTLVLITGEVRDYFEREIALLPQTETDRAHVLANLEQMLLSSSWLVYSILLMGYGLWKRIRPLRIAAIVLFGIAILKIFIYDLSFLDTLYRIFSFIGLGIILLAVSYLYQRYRAVIFEGNP